MFGCRGTHGGDEFIHFAKSLPAQLANDQMPFEWRHFHFGKGPHAVCLQRVVGRVLILSHTYIGGLAEGNSQLILVHLGHHFTPACGRRRQEPER